MTHHNFIVGEKVILSYAGVQLYLRQHPNTVLSEAELLGEFIIRKIRSPEHAHQRYKALVMNIKTSIAIWVYLDWLQELKVAD